MDNVASCCELCGREAPLTFHHLIPKALHKKAFYQKRYTKEEMQTTGLMICQQCHSTIHRFFDLKDLGKFYHSKALLLTDERFASYIAWAKKQH
ncbi:HNH endonuclease [Eisenibacter elegans]|uniref:HNH endonuclease n=1 Tax=Eisenibacter elegans TaxID=997 RepID=UPI0004242818|nr:HNH endonuclease [Eisenibacter elegans]